jgi:hypothetical protein
LNSRELLGTAALQMEKVPKIVRERMLAMAVSVAHPDADVLTAFSEHTLPERERGPILDHLARCSECREVIALALPAEDAAPVVIRPARNPWLTWPRMRWAFVAAGVVVVASVGLLQFQLKSRQATVAHSYDAAPAAGVTTEARNQPAQQIEAPEAAKQAAKIEEKREAGAPVPPQPSAKKRRDEDRETDSFYNSGTKNENTLSGGVVLGNRFRGQQLAHGPKPPIQFQQNAELNLNTNNGYPIQTQTPASAPSPGAFDQQASRQLVNIPPPSSVGGPLNDKQALDKVAVNGRNNVTLQASGASSGAEIARAKPATTANTQQASQATEAYAVTTDGLSNFSTSGSLVPESARWSINSVGGLQRSVDQGRTWQDVDVNGAVGRGDGMGLQMAMKTSRAKVAKDKADAKEKPIVFRAVSANGPDVWAGGSEGKLYHSTDSGANWVRVVPSWRGIDLTSDVLNLQFSDPQHGRIVSSAAEIWTTADGGQTWDKH